MATNPKTYAVFTITPVDDEKTVWRRVGTGYLNRDGSYNLVLDALPVSGKLHMRAVDDTKAVFPNE